MSAQDQEAIMKELTLDETLTLGIEEIDGDHSKLIELYNILNQSVTKGASREYVEAVLEEMINCTIWHFSHEERLMLKYGYSGYEQHKQDHKDLIEGASKLKQKFLQAGKLEEEDLVYLERWLTEHILVSDSRLADFLIEAM